MTTSLLSSSLHHVLNVLEHSALSPMVAPLEAIHRLQNLPDAQVLLLHRLLLWLNVQLVLPVELIHQSPLDATDAKGLRFPNGQLGPS